MPYMHVQTNQNISGEQAEKVLGKFSARIADCLGKPERYVMIQLSGDASLVFSGSNAPCAYVELKSIGLQEAQTQQLSKEVCSMIDEMLGIPADRTYIEFTDAPRKYWGWNSSTF